VDAPVGVQEGLEAVDSRAGKEAPPVGLERDAGEGGVALADAPAQLGQLGAVVLAHKAHHRVHEAGEDGALALKVRVRAQLVHRHFSERKQALRVSLDNYSYKIVICALYQ